MTHCWLCGASEIKLPNSKYTYYGKILGEKSTENDSSLYLLQRYAI